MEDCRRGLEGSGGLEGSREGVPAASARPRGGCSIPLEQPREGQKSKPKRRRTTEAPRTVRRAVVGRHGLEWTLSVSPRWRCHHGMSRCISAPRDRASFGKFAFWNTTPHWCAGVHTERMFAPERTTVSAGCGFSQTHPVSRESAHKSPCEQYSRASRQTEAVVAIGVLALHQAA